MWFFIPIWIGILVLPLMGLKNSLAMAGVIAIGGLFWKGVISFSQSSQFQSFWNNSKKWGDPILQWRPRPWQQKILEIVAWGGLILIPQDMNNYYLDVLTTAGIYVVLALGLNIVVGMAGLLDLGYISFYAIGAYTYAILSTQFGVPFWIGLPIGGMAAGSLGVVLGLVTLRLRGDYIAIVTLGFVQIIYLILKNWDSVTNGPNGILNIPRPSLGSFLLQDPIHLYYLILLIVALTVFAVSRLIHSRVGRSWMAIREDEVAAQAMGVDTTRMKILAFGLGAFWAGLAGVFFSAKMAFVSPESFTFFESVFILTMVVLGGMGSIPGVILGAVVLIVLPEMFRGFESYRMLLFGGAMVLMMIFRPQGLIGNPRRKVELQTGNKTALS